MVGRFLQVSVYRQASLVILLSTQDIAAIHVEYLAGDS